MVIVSSKMGGFGSGIVSAFQQVIAAVTRPDEPEVKDSSLSESELNQKFDQAVQAVVDGTASPLMSGAEEFKGDPEGARQFLESIIEANQRTDGPFVARSHHIQEIAEYVLGKG